MSTFEILKKLKTHYPSRCRRCSTRFDEDDYSSLRINNDGPGRFDMEKRTERLMRYVNDAKYILDEVEDIEKDERL